MGSRTVLSREGRRYRASVCAALAVMRVVRMNGRLEVRVTVCPPDNRRRDLDNVQKALLDALAKGGAYRDDSQIDRLVVERGPVTPGGKVRVEISQLNPRTSDPTNPIRSPRCTSTCGSATTTRAW